MAHQATPSQRGTQPLDATPRAGEALASGGTSRLTRSAGRLDPVPSAQRGTQPIDVTPLEARASGGALRNKRARALACSPPPDCSPPARANKQARVVDDAGPSSGPLPSPGAELPTALVPPLTEELFESGPVPEAPAPRALNPAWAGGCASPVPLHAAQALLRRRLLRGEGCAELSPALSQNYTELLSLLQDTLSGSQNNSVLLLGPRGSGKSLVLRRALASVARSHGDACVHVHLTGLLHCDERVAMRELAVQLGEHGCADALQRVSKFDTMALLAGFMRALERDQRSAVFVLDEFDVFTPVSRRQLLLYNLLDALQASSVRAVVVGLSVCNNAAERLEKRVRSRFSHRRLVFAAQTQAEGGPCEAVGLLLALPPSFPHPAFAARWNGALATALASPRVAAALAEACARSAQPRDTAALCLLALAGPEPTGPGLLEEGHLVCAAAACGRDPLDGSLLGLPPCELHLLVAAKRLQRMRELTAFNFAALFGEYERMACALGASVHFPRDVALRAFEALLHLGALGPADAAAAAQAGGGRGGGWLKEYAAYRLLFTDAEVALAARNHPQAPTNLAHLLTHESVGATGVAMV